MSIAKNENENPGPQPQTFGQRHGVSILTFVLFGLLALVMMVQVGC